MFIKKSCNFSFKFGWKVRKINLRFLCKNTLFSYPGKSTIPRSRKSSSERFGPNNRINKFFFFSSSTIFEKYKLTSNETSLIFSKIRYFAERGSKILTQRKPTYRVKFDKLLHHLLLCRTENPVLERDNKFSTTLESFSWLEYKTEDLFPHTPLLFMDMTYQRHF